MEDRMFTRRAFLKGSTLCALTPLIPAFLKQTARAARPQRDGRILVVLQFDGGNDGINTVVPYKDEGYAKHRRTLRLPESRLLKHQDIGLHYALTSLGELLEAGQLAIVQGVGYPNPSRSHFESMAIWQSARRDKEDRGGLGWLGRAYDVPGKAPTNAPASVYVGPGDIPEALLGRRAIASALTRPEDYVLDPKVDPRLLAAPQGKDDLTAFIRRTTLDATLTADRMAQVLDDQGDSAAYPRSELGKHLQLISRLMKANTGTRVFYTRQGSYDTHAAQFGTHQQLLSDLSAALGAFWKDLTGAKLAERVVLLMFSEFGRTVKENNSAGTDHGTAAPVFLAGPGVRGGLVGKTPSLLELDPKYGDLTVGIDFRQVYATVLTDWLNLSSEQALGGSFERLPLFRVAAK
jgi:uncharacterized protein (DUF1501 family)